VSTDVARACYDDFAGPAAWRVLPGAREAVAWARTRRLGVAVVSNFDVRLAAILEGLGLGPFGAVVTSGEVRCALAESVLQATVPLKSGLSARV
jgi:FMN phosphatase YigB (HAD superfamily)